MSTRLAAWLLLVTCVLAVPRAYAQWLVSGTPVATAVDYQMNPTLVPDGNRGAIIVWEDGRSGGGTFDLYAQRVDSSGVATWVSGGTPVCIAANSQLAPVAVPDGYGGAMVFWLDNRTGSWQIYGMEIDANGTLLWTPNGLPICNAPGDRFSLGAISDGNPGIVIGSEPGAILAWGDGRNVANSSGYDIYVQHIDRTGGAQWNTNGVLLCGAVGGQFSPQITTDGTGFGTSPKGAFVVWEDYRQGVSIPSDIYVGRVSSGGVVSWGTDGVPVCTAEGGQGSPQIAFVGAGRAVVTWTDSRPTDYGIYAQKIDNAGAVQWAANGIPVVATPASRANSRVVSDGLGGAFVVWNEGAGSTWDIHAQRLDTNGARLWGAEGKPVCAASGVQTLTQVIPDGAGGLIVLWKDSRDVGTTLAYVQRLDADGNPLWNVDGIPVARNDADQENPRLTNSPNGGAIVAWQDWRGTFYDIYANRVFGSGTVDAGGPAPASFRVALLGANPVRGTARFAVELPEDGTLTAEVFDPAGRRVRTLEPGRRCDAGTHHVAWDGSGEAGSPARPGIYFVRVGAGTRSTVVKVVRVR